MLLNVDDLYKIRKRVENHWCPQNRYYSGTLDGCIINHASDVFCDNSKVREFAVQAADILEFNEKEYRWATSNVGYWNDAQPSNKTVLELVDKLIAKNTVVEVPDYAPEERVVEVALV